MTPLSFGVDAGLAFGILSCQARPARIRRDCEALALAGLERV